MNKKKRNQLNFRWLHLKVTTEGFEPPTLRAEIWYSIQLNYAAKLFQIFDFRFQIAMSMESEIYILKSEIKIMLMTSLLP